MQTLYFGPQKNLLSWFWVGQDIAETLTQIFRIRYFSDVDEIESGAVVFWIKHPGSDSDIPRIRDKKLRIIYFPVDQYQDENELVGGRDFINACSLLVCHTESMGDLFAGKPVQFVDHYNKYGIDPSLRAPGGRFLWIGGYQYFPYLYNYLVRTNLTIEIDILTDYRHPPAIAAANRLARQLDIDTDFCDAKNFPEFNLIEWTESRQQALLLSCEGAFDYKHMLDFNQRYKPPTKVQKYLASGIPTAVNWESASFKQMQAGGLELCDPTQTDVWRSASYRTKLAEYGEALARKLTKSAISARYVEFVGLVS
jgi:hypothetical protein